MIGIWMAPNGDTTVLIEKLREAATSWGVKMRMGRSSKLEAWTGLQTNIFATLKYPLAACTLTESECKSIMAPAVRAALPKAGISSTMSTTVRNAPIESLGMGVLDSYLFMGTARTSMMTHHCWSNTPTGVLLQMCIEDLALDSGLYGLLWNQEFKFSEWTVKHSIIFHACKFNHKHEIVIGIKHHSITKRRNNDRSIIAVASKHISKTSSLRAINRLRQFHNVVHLSDIAAADGRGLNHRFLAETQFTGKRNDYKWPHGK